MGVLEQIEFTRGEGPSLSAPPQMPVCSNADEITTRWPSLRHGLVAPAAYRTLVSMPLPGLEQVRGRIDIWLTGSSPAPEPAFAAAMSMARMAAGILTAATDSPSRSPADDPPRPGWLANPLTVAREQVPVAVGMLQTSTGAATTDAIAMLRGHAYTNGRLLDEVADDLTHYRLSTSAVADA